MSLEYTKIQDDPEQLSCDLLVRPSDYANIPITLPNWTPEPCYMTSRYQTVGQQIKDMEVRPDDVWLAGYPKSGTTWCSEMIWLVCNDLDYARAAALNIFDRFRLVEMSGVRDNPEHFHDTLSQPSPRFIKTHLPVGLLPDRMWTVKPKLVYVRRNPKSVAVSSYYLSVSLLNYKGSMQEFLESFVKQQMQHGPYHSQVIDYHHLDYQGNILYLCFEDMKKNLKGELERVCAFFNKSYSDQQLNTLAEHLSFNKLKDNKSVNLVPVLERILKETNRSEKLNDENYKFIRKGEIDGWKTELTEEQQQLLDNWTKSKVLDPEHLKLF